MYATCLFCNRPLGSNESIEHFPVGRRLAFDASNGRLWVVCPACERWNLTPLEERWEAIEDCERRFRDSRLRSSTEHVGLARLTEGLELVRIGRPLRPEMAAWRYGRLLNRRYFRAAGWKVAGALSAGIMSGGVIAGVVSIPMAMMLGGFGGPLAWWVLGSVEVERLRLPDSRELHVTQRDLRDVRVVRDDRTGWALLIPRERGNERLIGPAAASALGRLLVHVNRGGASEYVLDQALDRLGDSADTGTLLRETAHRLARDTHRRWLEEQRRDWWGRTGVQDDYPSIVEIDRPLRVAMEMALHEETERVAIEGELAPLEAAWREAEEVAAIADGLLLPAPVTRQLAELRARADGSASRQSKGGSRGDVLPLPVAPLGVGIRTGSGAEDAS